MYSFIHLYNMPLLYDRWHSLKLLIRLATAYFKSRLKIPSNRYFHT